MQQAYSFRARRLRVPLAVPYKLAFGPVEAFDTILVEAKRHDGVGYGEATVLTGYTEETVEGAWALTRELVGQLGGLGASAAVDICKTHLADAPFTSTAFMSAIEMARHHPVLLRPAERKVRLLALLNGTNEAQLAEEIAQLAGQGFRTLKIKVGFDWRADLARVTAIQKLVKGRNIVLTVDANQGYSEADAVAFAKALAPDDVLFFEQACHKDDWDAAVSVARAARVPTMLDESIYDLSDVERAARLRAARYVKLKLMKAGSIDALLEGVRRARELGLEPVMGNGVATDVGCWMEACIAAEARVETAGEMNGFLKPQRALVANPLPVWDGCVVIPPGWQPILDEDEIAARTTATADPEL